jgi:hypothetical protein
MMDCKPAAEEEQHKLLSDGEEGDVEAAEGPAAHREGEVAPSRWTWERIWAEVA